MKLKKTKSKYQLKQFLKRHNNSLQKIFTLDRSTLQKGVIERKLAKIT